MNPGETTFDMADILETDATTESQKHALLLHSGELLHRYGTPSYRLEAAMESVSQSIGVPGTFLYTPTALVVSLGEAGNETTYLRRVDQGGVDISKLLAFDLALEELANERRTIQQTHDRFEEIASNKPIYGLSMEALAGAAACGSVAVLFGGGVFDILIAALLGIVVSGLTLVANIRNGEKEGWINPLTGFVVALCALAAATLVPTDYHLTTLAALIIPIPGLSLTIALTELAVGHFTAGSARLAGASTKLLTLVFGVAIAWQIGGSLVVKQPVGAALPGWCVGVAVLVAPVSFAILFRAPLKLWPAIVATCASGFIANRVGDHSFGPELGAFAGAFLVGVCSNAYARWFNRPAMALLTPGVLVLVPGSIGYRSATAMLERNTVEGVEFAFAAVMVGISLVGGIVMANVVFAPKRCL